MNKYFVSNDNNSVLDTKFKNLLDGLFTENGSRGISRVDDDQGFAFLSILSSILDRSFELREVELPACLFVHVVRCSVSSVERNGSTVEWILRNGN